MLKTCARCEQPFTCLADDISNCHCSAIQLSAKTLAKISERYENCLCSACLLEIKNEEIKD